MSQSNFLCSNCGSHGSRVIDSKAKSAKGNFYGYIIRRRRCLECNMTQLTYETTTKPIGKRGATALETLIKIRNFLDIELSI